MARTMTDEQERAIRVWADGFPQYKDEGFLMMVLRELDAERAAHEETNALLKAEIKAHAKTQARLALAEAVCESCDVCDSFGVSGKHYDSNALAAWRAAK